MVVTRIQGEKVVWPTCHSWPRLQSTNGNGGSAVSMHLGAPALHECIAGKPKLLWASLNVVALPLSTACIVAISLLSSLLSRLSPIPLSLSSLSPSLGISLGTSLEPSLEHLSIIDRTPSPRRGESCLLYTSPSPRDKRQSRMPSSA